MIRSCFSGSAPLPAGPTAWPVDESLIEDEESETTTSDEEA